MGGIENAPLFGSQHMVTVAGTEIGRKQWKGSDVMKRFQLAGNTVRAAKRFAHFGMLQTLTRRMRISADPAGCYEVSSERLTKLVEGKDTEDLADAGGVSGLARSLKVDLDKGLSEDEEDFRKRAIAFGTNTYPAARRTAFWEYVWEALQDTTMQILALCAAVSLAVGLSTEDPAKGWYDGAGIAFAIVLVLVVGSTSNYQQSLQFASLNDEKRKIFLNVTRGGKRMKLSIFEILVGDIVHISIGDQVPADGILIQGHSLTIDESSMTGESEHVHVNEKHPFLVSGCKVMDGFGSSLVTGVGMNTEWGRVMSTLNEDNEEDTPLQLRLDVLASSIGKMGLSVAVLVLVVLIIRFFATVDFHHFSSHDVRTLVNFFAIAVTIVVVSVPEGLPLAVTLTLAYSMHKMMVDKALVRKLAACETMGSATTICSDKTGTLTMNMMTVVKSWCCGALREPDHTMEQLSKEAMAMVHESVCLNTNGAVEQLEDGSKPVINGSPTESAVLAWACKLGAKFNPVRASTEVIVISSFNSEKKRMGVIIKTKNEGKFRVHWKGAAEIVLEQCDKVIDENGFVLPMTSQKKTELHQIIDTFARNALRALCLCYRDLRADEVPGEGQDMPDQGMVCLAIVGIKDPCRPGVPEAVAVCQKAGILVRMVTGDNLTTGMAIARECGILQAGGVAIEGKDFRVMTPEAQKLLLPSLQVMARSSPTDKHMLVRQLLEMGEVVAVTGDGTNDAPALHEASIGLAMGICGTEVAKEASDIVILDDNFASIIKVVRWGRAVFFNIQKFIQFQMTVNLVALSINFVSAVGSGYAPLTAVQLLWVNLIMDTLGALALATEPPSDELMKEKPIGSTAPLMTNKMWRNIACQWVYQLVVLLVMQYQGANILNLHPLPSLPGQDNANPKLICMIFNAFVFCQVFNQINARKPYELNVFAGILQSTMFNVVWLFTCIIQVLLVEFVGTFTSTTPLSWSQWLICIGIGALSIPIAFVCKFIPVPEKPFAELWWRRRTLRQAHVSDLRRASITHKSATSKSGASVSTPAWSPHSHSLLTGSASKTVRSDPSLGPNGYNAKLRTGLNGLLLPEGRYHIEGRQDAVPPAHKE